MTERDRSDAEPSRGHHLNELCWTLILICWLRCFSIDLNWDGSLERPCLPCRCYIRPCSSKHGLCAPIWHQERGVIIPQEEIFTVSTQCYETRKSEGGQTEVCVTERFNASVLLRFPSKLLVHVWGDIYAQCWPKVQKYYWVKFLRVSPKAKTQTFFFFFSFLSLPCSVVYYLAVLS